MATLKEAIDSGNPFRHDARGPWMTYDKQTGELKRRDGQGSNHSDIITTFLALSDRWEIQAPPAIRMWYRPAIMWDTRKKRYVEGREWFKHREEGLEKIHPSMVIIKWQEWAAPDLSSAY